MLAQAPVIKRSLGYFWLCKSTVLIQYLQDSAENKAAFRSSKWFHSINVQVICEAHYHITNVAADISWPTQGSSNVCEMCDWKRQSLETLLIFYWCHCMLKTTQNWSFKFWKMKLNATKRITGNMLTKFAGFNCRAWVNCLCSRCSVSRVRENQAYEGKKLII